MFRVSRSNEYDHDLNSAQVPKLGLDVPSQINARIGDAFTIGFTLREGSPVIEYQWLRNGFIIPGADQERYAVNSATREDAGEYRCEVKNDCGVILTGICIVTIEDPVSVQEELEAALDLSLEPQPFSEEATVRFTLPESGQVTATVVDMSGQVVMTLADEVRNAGTNALRINGSQLGASGTYLVRLEYNGGFVTAPIILAR